METNTRNVKLISATYSTFIESTNQIGQGVVGTEEMHFLYIGDEDDDT